MRLGLHVHHEILIEELTESIQNRIDYIKVQKPKAEISLRLRLLRALEPTEELILAWAEYKKIQQSALAEYEKIRQPAWAEYEKIRQPAWAKVEAVHKKVCPNCPWDGKTIFTRKNEKGEWY